jgi:hypothetical protein
MALTNEFGEKLDRNGYAPSIMGTEAGRCWWCDRYTPTERHEVFFGSLRQKAKELGLWVDICIECHRTGKNAVHQCKDTADRMKNMAQITAMRKYGWTEEEFVRRFYKSYLHHWRTENV